MLYRISIIVIFNYYFDDGCRVLALERRGTRSSVPSQQRTNSSTDSQISQSVSSLSLSLSLLLSLSLPLKPML